MTCDIEAGGVVRRVERRDGRLLLDGRVVEVDAVRAGSGWSLLIGHRSHEVLAIESAPGELTVHVNGRAMVVRGSVQRFGSRRQGLGAGGAAARGAQRIVAPMPGRVTKVLVRVGDTVSARQALVVVEAMKMENELRASRAGAVTEVRAVEGALVDANAVLIVLE